MSSFQHRACEVSGNAAEGGRAAIEGGCIVLAAVRLLSVAATILLPFLSQSAEVTLSDGGDIAAAVAAAEAGDTIWLETGTYSVNGLVIDKELTISAKEGAEATLDLQKQAGGITLKAAGAVLKGCSLVNCRTYAVKVQAEGAKLLDCVCTGINEISGRSVANFLLEAGEIRGCTISGFTGQYAYDNYIVHVKGGTFADSVITGAGSEFDWMVCVNGSSAVMTNVVIRNSPGKGTGGTDNINNGVLYLGPGLVTHCVITNSGSSGAAKSGTINIAGGTLRNSLVAGCKSPYYPGVYMSSGRLENCTVANNTGAAGTVAAYSLMMIGGTAVNNIFSDEANSVKSVVVSGGTFVTNLVPVEIGCGVGNVVGRPSFVAPENGDYSPGFSSPAVDSADRLDWMTADSLDVRGESRIKGAGPDLGAFEGPYGDDDPLAVGASIENNVFRSDNPDNTVVFSASACGKGSSSASYAWYIDGSATAAGTGTTFSYSQFSTGLHAVRLVVTPTDSSLDPVEMTFADCVFVYPKTVYVDSACATPEAPYTSWGTAAKTIKAALDFLTTDNAYLGAFGDGEEDSVTIEVRDGTYVLDGVTLQRPVRMVAADGATPVIDTNRSIPGISLMHAANVLDGFTITKASKFAIQLYNGAVMRNCTVKDAYNSLASNSDAIILCSSGVISNCLFSGGTAGYAYGNSLIKLTGASFMTGCTIEKMKNHDYTLCVAGELSVVSNCVLRDCPMDSCGGNLRYNMIDLTAGLVTHCIVTNCGNTACTGNGDKGFGALVCVRGSKATLRNCLLTDNKAVAKAGIYMTDGKVENCTVLGGSLSASTVDTSKRNLYQTGGDVVNSIFWNESGSDGVTVSGGTFTYSSSVSEKSGDGNKAGDPKLDSAFVPTATSFARDNGTLLDWMTEGAVDLRGSNRVVNAKVDLGAMEGDELPPELILTLESAFSRLDGGNIVYAVTPMSMIGSDVQEDVDYEWTVDGEDAGTSVGAKEFSLAPKTAAYSIGCTAAVSGQSVTEYHELYVHTGVFYVSAAGSGEYPYATWETAAKTLQNVLDVAHPAADTRVYQAIVADGNYTTCDAVIDKPTAVLGAGDVIFNAGGNLSVGHDLAVVSNCVFSGRRFMMTKGLVKDCVVRNVSSQSGGTLLTISGGVCEGLVVTNCRTTAWNFQYGVSVSGTARLTDFTIDNCAGYDSMLSVSGSAVVSNGVISSSNGVLGSGQANTHEYLICQSGGLVSHVCVTDCGDTRATEKWSSSGGSVRVTDGTLRNCLVAGNRSTDCAGVFLSGGHLESCTVVVNDGDSLHNHGNSIYGSCLYMTGGFATNCVFYSKETPVDGKYYCRVSGGKIGNCWLGVKGSDPTPAAGEKIFLGTDPGFKSDDGLDFVPCTISPLVGAGRNLPWMKGSKDLAGENRIRGRLVDIGAFEGVPRGFVMIVR